MTLKIKSRSPKSNQLFTPSQHCICASLVKICPLVHKIMHGNKISYIKEGPCDLENWAMVTKILTRSALPTVYLCKFGQNPFIGSKITHGNEATRTPIYGIHTKNNMPPPLRLGGHNDHPGPLQFNSLKLACGPRFNG